PGKCSGSRTGPDQAMTRWRQPWPRSPAPPRSAPRRPGRRDATSSRSSVATDGPFGWPWQDDAMAQPPPMQINQDAIYQVTIETDRGPIVMELDPRLAP